MPLLRLARLQLATSVTRSSARATLKTHAAPPFPMIPTCPDPTCPCSSMPAGLDIDRKAHLSGTMSAHSQHLIVSTGRSDWTSRIENEQDTAVWGKFTADVKSMLGRKGEFFDVCLSLRLGLNTYHYTYTLPLPYLPSCLVSCRQHELRPACTRPVCLKTLSISARAQNGGLKTGDRLTYT